MALIITVLLTLTLAGATFVTIHIVQSTLRDQIGENFQSQAESLSDSVSLFLFEKMSELQVLVSLDSMREPVAARNASYGGSTSEILAEILSLDARWVEAADDDPLILNTTADSAALNPAGRELAGFLESFPAHTEVFVTDRYGATIAATGRLSDYYQADEEWWQAAWNNGAGAVYVSDPEFDESAGVTALLMAVPIYDHDARTLLGVLRSTLNVEELFDVVGSVSFGETGHAVLLDGSGEVIFDPRSQTEPFTASLGSAESQALAEGHSGSVASSDTITGYASLLNGRAVPGDATAAYVDASDAIGSLDWTAVIQQDSSEALASVNLINRVGIVVGIVAVALGSVVALLAAGAVTRPLAALGTATQEIGAGNLQARLPKAGSDEIGRLTTSFGNMATRLRGLVGSLESRSAELARANEDLQREVSERMRAEQALQRLNETLEGRIEERTCELSDMNRQLHAEIAERKRFEAQLAHAANYDALTGLLNRRRFEEELDSHLAQARRYGNSLAVLFLDIDQFKDVNDSLGHRAGDELITHLGTLLTKTLRESDCIGRLGGDEFTVLLPRAVSEEASVVAQKTLKAVRDHRFVVAGQAASMTVSIGIALFPEHGSTREELLSGADLAMYQAKEAGRNRVCMSTLGREWQAQMGSKLEWRNRIHQALERNRFLFHAQPILDLALGEVSQHELLLRMVAEDGKVLLPSAFLGVAERSGSIQAIERWVVSRAMHVVAEERREDHEPCPAINISGKALEDGGLLPLLRREMSAAGVNPASLVLEVTETAAVTNIDKAQAFAATVREMGCRIALDDFGTGISSFYLLKHLPVDFLKIDGSFVQDLPRSPIDQQLVRAMAELASELGIATVAEHVGDAETVELLRAFGVNYAQGYHIGRPGPVSETLARTRLGRERAA